MSARDSFSHYRMEEDKMSFKAVKEFFTRKPLRNIFIIYLVDGLFSLFSREDKRTEFENKRHKVLTFPLHVRMRIYIASGFYYHDPFIVTSFAVCTYIPERTPLIKLGNDA